MLQLCQVFHVMLLQHRFILISILGHVTMTCSLCTQWPQSAPVPDPGVVHLPVIMLTIINTHISLYKKWIHHQSLSRSLLSAADKRDSWVVFQLIPLTTQHPAHPFPSDKLPLSTLHPSILPSVITRFLPFSCKQQGFDWNLESCHTESNCIPCGWPKKCQQNWTHNHFKLFFSTLEVS